MDIYRKVWKYTCKNINVQKVWKYLKILKYIENMEIYRKVSEHTEKY